MEDPTQQDEAAPTVAESPAARSSKELDAAAATAETLPRLGMGSAHGASGSTPSATTVTTPHEALHLDEIRRSRTLAGTAVILTPIAAALLPVLGGDPTARWLAVAGLLTIAVSNAYLFWIARPDRYAEWQVGVIWWLATLGLLPLVYYFGVFSAALAVLVLGMYFIGQGHSWPIASLVYATAAVGHAAMGLAISSGALSDVGLLSSDDLAMAQRIVALVLIQLILLTVYMLARVSRKTMLRSVEDLQDAVRNVAQREALLDEARQDFARALRIGEAGRFSGAVLGSFELAHVIGRGAMGEVYLATHKTTGEQAAVKVLLSGAAALPGSLARFIRETQIAASLDSPHVVKVLEVGDDGAEIPYLAMELLEGTDLATLLRQRGRLDIDSLAELIKQVGEGLKAAATAGIVHRDVKPQNLFHATGLKLWKILDFGVSKIAGGSGTLTQGAVVGTPAYMAPEQASGVDVDERADLYSLGAIAYRCLTGRPPFSGKDIAPILYKVVNEMPPAPSAVSDVDADLDLAFQIAMAKEPGDRFESATELHGALVAAARGRLPIALRRRGEALSRKHPWRQTIRGPQVRL